MSNSLERVVVPWYASSCVRCRTADLPLFRITDHRAGLAMVVYLHAQRPAVHADGLRCTNMYETRNETVVQPDSRAAVPGLILSARVALRCWAVLSGQTANLSWWSRACKILPVFRLPSLTWDCA